MKEYLKKSQRFVALVLTVLVAFTMMPMPSALAAVNTGVAGDRYPDKDTAKAGYTLSGVVKDSAGKLVSGASVKLTGGTKAKTATTDKKGAYKFTGVVKGSSYVLTTSKAGYADVVTKKFSISKTLTKNVKLYPINITVSVKDEDGNVIKNADVVLKRGTASLKGKTNASGKIVFEKATKGDYTGTITATGYEKATVKKFAVTKTVTKNVEMKKEVVVEVKVTKVEVKTAPTKVTYTVGDKLDLTGLVATLTMSDGKTEDVALADFAAKGLTVTPANEAVLAVTDTMVTVEHTATKLSVTTPITVAAAAVEITGVTLASITAPVTGATPQATYTPEATANYTGAIVWAPADATFAADTEYKATITLTAKTGFKFKAGFAAADVVGLPTTGAVVTPSTDDGATVKIEITCPKTVATAAVANASVLSATKVKVEFTKAVKAVLPSNFDIVLKGSTSPLPINSAVLASDKMSATITLFDSLTKTKTYTVTAKNITLADDAVMASSSKDFDYNFSAPATIAFTSTVLPRTAIDLSDYVEVKDANNNTLVYNEDYKLVFAGSFPGTDTGSIDLGNYDVAQGPVFITATVKDAATVTTGQKSFTVQAVVIGSISAFSVKANGTDVAKVALGSTAALTTAVTALDQFGNTLASTSSLLNNITYRSSNPNVLSITTDGKTITPLFVGTVTLTATVGSVSKSITFEVTARAVATNFEVPAALTVAGVSTAPRTALTIKSLDQNAVAVGGAGVVFTTTDTAASLYTAEAYGTPIATGSTLTTASNGELTVYVGGNAAGTANFKFKLGSGTTAVEKTVVVTASATGAVANWLVESTDSTISKTAAENNSTATIKVYEVDANGIKVKDVSLYNGTPYKIEYAMPAVTGIQPASAQNIFELVDSNAKVGDYIVTVKKDGFVIGSVTISVTETTNLPKTATLVNSTLQLNNLNSIYNFSKATIAKNFIMTMADNTELKDATDPDGTLRAQYIGAILSTDVNVVKVTGNTVVASAVTGTPAAYGLDLKKGTSVLTVTFSEDSGLAPQSFNVALGDVALTADTTIAAAGNGTTTLAKLVIGSGVKVTIPSGKVLKVAGDSLFTNGGTLENNGQLAYDGSTLVNITAGATTSKISGTGKIVNVTSNTNALVLKGSHQIVAGAKQTIEGGSSTGLNTVVKVTGTADNKSSLTIDGTVVVTNATIEKNAQLNADAHGKITVSGTGKVDVLAAKKIVAQNISASFNAVGGGAIENNGSISLNTDVDVVGGYTIAAMQIQTASSFVNNGTVSVNTAKDTHGAFIAIRDTSTFEVNGSLNLGSAQSGLELGDKVTTIIRGSIINNGEISSDTGTGTLTIEPTGLIDNTAGIFNNAAIMVVKGTLKTATYSAAVADAVGEFSTAVQWNTETKAGGARVTSTGKFIVNSVTVIGAGGQLVPTTSTDYVVLSDGGATGQVRLIGKYTLGADLTLAAFDGTAHSATGIQTLNVRVGSTLVVPNGKTLKVAASTILVVQGDTTPAVSTATPSTDGVLEIQNGANFITDAAAVVTSYSATKGVIKLVEGAKVTQGTDIFGTTFTALVVTTVGASTATETTTVLPAGNYVETSGKFVANPAA